MKEAVCQCKVTAFYLNKQENKTFNVKPLTEVSSSSECQQKLATIITNYYLKSSSNFKHFLLGNNLTQLLAFQYGDLITQLL